MERLPEQARSSGVSTRLHPVILCGALLVAFLLVFVRAGEADAYAPPPEGWRFPYCSTMGVQWPHAGNTVVPYALHFYRIQFKRVDGDGIKTHWKEWYPWMSKIAYDRKHTQAAAH